MKKIGIIALVLGIMLSFCSLFGCSNRNMQEELPGEWFIWHWYYNEKDGDNGFFDHARFYTFGEDGTLTMVIDGETTTATYSFVNKDTVTVVYEDQSTETFQLIPAERNGINEIQFMNVENLYTITLEPMSSWQGE